MGFTTKTQPEIKTDILRDIQNLQPGASVGDDSDFNVRASANSAAIEGLYEHQKWIVRQIFPDTADTDIMEVHANLRKVNYKPGTLATGSVNFTGVADSNIPLGAELKTADGLIFLTTSAGVIDGTGNAVVPARAAAVGVAYNIALNTVLTLTAAPAGVSSNASSTAFLAGTDAETPSSLLTRLLAVLRDPPSSGNDADYKRWALEVAGCDNAKVFPLRRGLGTTDVFISSASGLPSLDLINAVTANIDAQRPCGVNTLSVLAPTLLVQDHTIQVKVSAGTLAEVTASINQALDGYYANLGIGQPYIKSEVEALISDLAVVTDRAVTLPAANVVPTVNAVVVEWCRKGAVTVTLMP